MNETIKLTASQLNEKIAELRGWVLEDTDRQHKWLNVLENCLYREIPDYTKDIAAAMPLFRELPYAELAITTREGSEMKLRWRQDDEPRFLFVRPKHEPLAIARAWYQWKNGTVVEFIEGE